MNKKILFLIISCFLFLIQPLQAQDIIIKRDRSRLDGKVISIKQDSVFFTNPKNLPSDTIAIPQNQILLVEKDGIRQYFNPVVDHYNTYEDQSIPTISLSNRMYVRGMADANTFYNGYRVESATILGTSIFFSALITLVPTIVITSIRPQEKNLGYPNQDLMENVDYSKGYKKGAKRKKSRRIWRNWGIGLVTNVIIGAFFLR